MPCDAVCNLTFQISLEEAAGSTMVGPWENADGLNVPGEVGNIGV